MAFSPLLTKQSKKRILRQLLCVQLALITCFISIAFSAQAQSTPPANYKILDEAIAPVNSRLFGHFLERASWGEPGPEIALQPGTRELYPEAIALMQQMNIPVIRFPGGTDVDYTDWRDLISNVPGRLNLGRPITTGHDGHQITNQFGLDEYFDLRDQLTAESTTGNKVETILVANFLDAVSRKLTLAEAAQNAASLVAYTNAEIDAALPAGMTDWPAVRAKNGHPDPFGIEYLQIGNELWLPKFQQQAKEGSGLSDTAELADWYLQCLQAYIAAIDEIDPSIELIVDGNMGEGIEQTVLTDDKVKSRVKYVTFHDYAPGPVNSNLRKHGEPVEASELSENNWWHAWVAMPGKFSDDGLSMGLGNRIEFARSLGYKIAVTEWNWNGWGFGELDPEPKVDWRMASSIGTAGFLQGLMRQGNSVEMACQSLLIGANWDITSIRVDPDEEDPPYFLPQGQMTMMYSNHHGSNLLRQRATQVPHYEQPFGMGWINRPDTDIATLDLLATADDHNIYLHAINRARKAVLIANLDLSDFSDLNETGTHYLFAEPADRDWLSAVLHWIKSPWTEEQLEHATISSQAVSVEAGTIGLHLPQQSVSIVVIPRT